MKTVVSRKEAIIRATAAFEPKTLIENDCISFFLPNKLSAKLKAEPHPFCFLSPWCFGDYGA
jgi:hypothetical protein